MTALAGASSHPGSSRHLHREVRMPGMLLKASASRGSTTRDLGYSLSCMDASIDARLEVVHLSAMNASCRASIADRSPNRSYVPRRMRASSEGAECSYANQTTVVAALAHSLIHSLAF